MVDQMNAPRRLFFALWPNAASRRELVSRQEALGLAGRKTAAANLHITLAFIGNADLAYCDCLRQAAATVTAEPFELTLNQLGYFSKPRVVWVGPSQVPVGLEILRAKLLSAIAGCGYTSRDDAFTPHVTLARKAPPVAPQSFSPITWKVDEFALVESCSTAGGVRYESLESYRLV